MKKILSIFLSLIMIFGTVAVGGTGIIAFAGDITEGLCGYDAIWCFNESTGTLTISGTGPVADIDDEGGDTSPWSEYKDRITTVIIEEGITRIGKATFVECVEITSVSIPSSVQSIGDSAFFQCSSLESIIIPASVSEIEMVAFCLCSSLESITILYMGNDMVIGEYAFEGIDASTIYGYADSSAQTLANAYGFNFVALGEHVHSYTATVTTEATCSSEGVMTYTCSCGDTKTEPITKKNHADSDSDGKCDVCSADVSGTTEHVHSYNGVVTTQQTCSTEGLMTYTCSCGDSYTKAIPAHFKGEPVIVSTYQELTCTQDGAYICKEYCTVCGVEVKDPLSSDLLMVVRATGHTDSNSDGICDVCSADVSGSTEHVHKYTATVTTQQTCSEAGVMTYTCECGDCYTEAIPAKNHTPAEAVKENEVPATETSDGSYDSVVYCSECGEEISRENIKTEKLSKDFYEASTDKTTIVRGDVITWTVKTSTNVTWLELNGSYTTAAGDTKNLVTYYKAANRASGSNSVTVTDKDETRTWVITMPLSYTASDASITESWNILYKVSGSTEWKYAEINDEKYVQTVTVVKNEDVLKPAPSEGYDKYTLVSAAADKTSAAVGETVTFTVVVTSDITKIRVGYVYTVDGVIKTKTGTYQTTSTNVKSIVDNGDGTSTWTISYKVPTTAAGVTHFNIQARGDAWGTAKTVNVNVK